MRSGRRQRRWSRRARHSAARPAVAIPAVQASALRDRLLASALLDRALGGLLVRPRALQLAGLVVGLAIVALTVRPLIWPSAPHAVPMNTTAVALAPVPALATPAAPLATGERDRAVLNAVAAYNQASITAAMLGRVDMLAPYLAPDGQAWAEVQAEYQRRAARGEAHEPALTRWGVMRIAVADDTATVETQEQWDDITTVGGQVAASRRGILTRNTYTLRRSQSMGSWLITDVVTTTLIN
jgi:hypothetical protein